MCFIYIVRIEMVLRFFKTSWNSVPVPVRYLIIVASGSENLIASKIPAILTTSLLLAIKYKYIPTLQDPIWYESETFTKYVYIPTYYICTTYKTTYQFLCSSRTDSKTKTMIPCRQKTITYILQSTYNIDTIDDVLWIDFFAATLNEAFRSPDHKAFF